MRLVENNKELEHKLHSLTEELKSVTKDRENLQERYSQQMIIMNKKLEDSKQQHEIMNLEHRIKSQTDSNQKELQQIEEHNKLIMRDMKTVIKSINSNKFFSEIQKNVTDTNKILGMKDIGIQEGERKAKKIYDRQIQEQTKERKELSSLYNNMLTKKDQEFEEMLNKYETVSKHRDGEIDKAKTEIVKIYTSILRQAKVINGIENGKYSNGMATVKIMDKIEIPNQKEFPMLFEVLKEKNGMLINENGQNYKKIDMNIFEQEGFETMSQEEAVKTILKIKETKDDFKKIRERSCFDMRVNDGTQKLIPINKLYLKSTLYETQNFHTINSNRPTTEYAKQRGSMTNLHSKLMMTDKSKNQSLVKFGNFFSSRKQKSIRAASIPSTRSKSNTKMN